MNFSFNFIKVIHDLFSWFLLKSMIFSTSLPFLLLILKFNIQYVLSFMAKIPLSQYNMHKIFYIFCVFSVDWMNLYVIGARLRYSKSFIPRVTKLSINLWTQWGREETFIILENQSYRMYSSYYWCYCKWCCCCCL